MKNDLRIPLQSIPFNYFLPIDLFGILPDVVRKSLYFIDYKPYGYGTNITIIFSLLLIEGKEICVSLPGILDTGLVIKELAELVINPTDRIDAHLSIGYIAFRLPKSFFTPLHCEGNKPVLENGVWKKEEGVDYRDIEIGFLDGIDDEARSRAIIMHYDSEGGFSIEYKIEGIRFNCLPVEISNSGIAFQFNGIDVRFSEGERGIFFNEVNIFFGSHLSFVPDGLSLTDGSITENGFCGKINAEWDLDFGSNDEMVGEASGYLLGEAGNGVAIGLSRLEIEFKNNSIFSSDIVGKILFPFSDRPIEIEATYESDGILAIKAKGEVHFGNGVWLFPVGDEPILSAQLDPGTSEYVFAVKGLFKAPRETDGTRTILLSGSLEYEIESGGLPVLRTFEVSSNISGLDWELPGNIKLSQARFSISYSEEDERVSAGIGGRLSPFGGKDDIDIQANLIFNDIDDPTNIAFDVSVDVAKLNIYDKACLFDSTLLVDIQTTPLKGSIAVSGNAGLFPLEHSSGTQPNDFELGVFNVDGKLSFDSGGFQIMFVSGQLKLPDLFGCEGDTNVRPSVNLSDTAPLSLQYDGSDLAFEGSLTFLNFIARVPGADTMAGLAVALHTATLEFGSGEVPKLTGVSGEIRIPLNDENTIGIDFEDISWALDGFPVGLIRLAEDIAIPLGGGFNLSILAGASSDSVPTGLTVTNTDGKPKFRLDGTIRLDIPADMLAQEDGAQIFIQNKGNVEISPDHPPKLEIEELKFGGTFSLGGADGILIKDAEIAAENLDNIFSSSDDYPFITTLSGKIALPDNGPALGLQEAKFVLTGATLRFDIAGLSIEPGELLKPLENLPLSLTKAEIHFKEERPLPEKLFPDNIQIILSAELKIPLPPDGEIQGKVDDLSVMFNDQGIPEIAIKGLGMGVEDVETGPLIVTGMVYIGGLDDPANNLFFAGKLGGLLNGTGVKALAAFGTKGPLGVCLDVNAGPAGIPLGPTGFLLTGVCGGVSFLNSNADPCDFTSYVQLGDDGRPVENPQPPTTPPSENHDDDTVITAPAPLPEEGESLQFDCPGGSCPPPSINIFSQPHPDGVKYPNRIIIKFTCLDETFLKNIGITPEYFETPGLTDAQSIAENISLKFREGIEDISPPLPDVGDLHAALMEQLNNIQTVLKNLLFEAIDTALGDNHSVYEAVKEIAYAGVPSPDVTVKLTGTFSYAGISTFLSVTGGYTISSTGTVGLLGSLNLAGIPVGKARGFVITSDDTGAPVFAFCGDVVAAVGPLELGQLRFKCDYGVDVPAMMGVVANFGQHLAGPFITEVVELVAEDIVPDESNPAEALAQLSPVQGMAFVAHIMSLPPERVTPDILNCLRDLIEGIWDNFEPEILLCGKAAPRFFGLPLGGEIVSISANARKDQLAAKFAFSPSFFISSLFGNIFPTMDLASLGFSISLPDPIELLDKGLTGCFQTPEALANFLEDGFDHVLKNAVFTIEYELSPFGLKLFDAEARFIPPDLINHPANPERSWVRPEDRGEGLPSRMDVMLAALRENKLGNPLWKGDSAEMASLIFENGASTQDLSLREDYFPHGGFLGAAKLALPKALLDTPPIERFEMIFGVSSNIADRLQALLAYIDEYLLTTEDVGDLSFYFPAPNPPVFIIEGRTLTPFEIMKIVQKHEFDLQQIRIGDAYSIEHAFIQGFMDARLLGVPVARAQLVVIPPDSQAGGEGLFEVRAGIPQGSWLNEFVEQADMVFQIRETPPEPIELRFEKLSDTIRTSSSAQSFVDEFKNCLIDELPKISLVAALNNFRIPQDLTAFLSVEGNVSAELHAYSLYYDPEFTGNGPLADVRRNGGIALKCTTKFGGGGLNGFYVDIPNAELSLKPGSFGLPAIYGRFEVERINLPAGLPGLSNAVLEFNSQPGPGCPVFFAKGKMPGIDIQPVLKVIPIGSQSLAASLKVVPTRANFPALSLEIQPAKIAIGGMCTGDIRIHGSSSSEPFSFSPSDPWAATISIKGLSFRDLLGNDFLWIDAKNQILSAALSGNGVNFARIELEIATNVDAVVFPKQEIERKISSSSANQGLLLSIASDGSFLVDASLPPINLGLFRIHGSAGIQAPLTVSISERGINIPAGAGLTLPVPGRDIVTLKQFVIGTNGDIDVQVESRDFSIGNFFSFSGGAMGFSSLNSQAQFYLKSPKLTLFTKTSYEKQINIGQLIMESNGRFEYDSGNQKIKIGDLCSAKGQLCLGSEPNLLKNPSCDEQLELGKILGWIPEKGDWTRRGNNPPPHHGRAYFAPTKDSGAVLYQDINLTAYKQTNRDEREFIFEGFVRTGQKNNTAKIILETRDKNNEKSLSQQAADIKNNYHNWERVFIRFKTNKDTWWIRVRLIAEGWAYFDQLKLQALPPSVISDSELEQMIGENFPEGPYVSLAGATVSFPAIGLDLYGGLNFNANTVVACFRRKPFKIDGLFELGAASWRMAYTLKQIIVGKLAGLRLIVQSPEITLLGKFPIAPPVKMEIIISSNSAYSAFFSSSGNISIIPQLLYVVLKNISLGRDLSGGHSLKIRGVVKALKNLDGNWILARELDLTVNDGPFETEIPGFKNNTVVNLAGLMTLKTQKVVFGKDERQNFYLKLIELQTTLFNYTENFTTKITTGGEISLELASRKTLHVGPFNLETNGKSQLSFKMRTPQLAVNVSGGKLKSRASINGWPSNGVTIPNFNFDSSGDFKVYLHSFSFDGISISTSGSNYAMLERKNGTVSVTIRNRTILLGCNMSLEFDISSMGAVTGKLTGSLRIKNPFPLGPGWLDFGSVSMSYSSSRKPYQFQLTRTFWPIKVRFEFGSGGARVVLAN